MRVIAQIFLPNKNKYKVHIFKKKTIKTKDSLVMNFH